MFIEKIFAAAVYLSRKLGKMLRGEMTLDVLALGSISSAMYVAPVPGAHSCGLFITGVALLLLNWRKHL